MAVRWEILIMISVNNVCGKSTCVLAGGWVGGRRWGGGEGTAWAGMKEGYGKKFSNYLNLHLNVLPTFCVFIRCHLWEYSVLVWNQAFTNQVSIMRVYRWPCKPSVSTIIPKILEVYLVYYSCEIVVHGNSKHFYNLTEITRKFSNMCRTYGQKKKMAELNTTQIFTSLGPRPTFCLRRIKMNNEITRSQ